jgi:predicted nucleotidyltransferase
MRKATAVTKLRARAHALKRMGAVSLYLFGSTARNQAVKDSDLDIFIDIPPRARFSLLDLAAIKRYLESELASAVDITTRGSLHPKLRRGIEQTAIRIF